MGRSPSGLSERLIAGEVSDAIGSGVAGDESDVVPECRDPDDGAGIVAPPKLNEHPSIRRRKTIPAIQDKGFRAEEGTGFIFPPFKDNCWKEPAVPGTTGNRADIS